MANWYTLKNGAFLTLEMLREPALSLTKARKKAKPEKYRSQYEIIKAILDGMPDGKTRLRFKSNMTWLYFNCYLNLILERGLASLTDSRFEISKKGEDYLETLNEILTLEKEG